MDRAQDARIEPPVRQGTILVLCAAAAAGVGVGVGLIGCSVPGDELPRAGTCDPFQLIDVSPAPDARNVSPDVVLGPTFNDFPDPDTISPANLVLYTGVYYHTGRFWVDLVERRALFKTSGDLRFGLGYTFVVKPAIRSLRGCRLQSPADPGDGQAAPGVYTFRFQVTENSPDRPPTPVPPPPPRYPEVIAVFENHCAGSACHLSGDAASPDGGAWPDGGAALDALAPVSSPAAARCLATPGGGLSLCERDARDALVGVPSRQVSPMVRVASQDASRSYLLRKIIGAPPLVGHSGVPNDNLSQQEKHVIQDWIDTGAPGPVSPAQARDGGV